MKTIGLLCCVPYLDQETLRASMRLGIEDARRRGVLHDEVNIVERFVAGLPGGSTFAVRQAWKELAAEGAVGIVGPVNSDNCHGVVETATEGKVATLPLGASYAVTGPWSFLVSFGSVPDESIMCVRWLADQGCRRIAVFNDTIWHGYEWLEFAESTAEACGVSITYRARIPAETHDPEHRLALARQAVDGARSVGCDGVAVLASTSGVPYATAVNDSGWDVPKAMTGGFTASRRPGLSPHFEGWVGTAMVDESNDIQSAFYGALERELGTRDFEEQAALPVYDATRVLFEGIALAPIKSPEGIRDGLEKVRSFPAAAGPAGTTLGFGPYDHGGYKGRHLVLRRYDGPDRDDWKKVPF